MYKIIAVLSLAAFAIFVGSCDGNKQGRDKYRFETKEYEMTNNKITFVISSSQQEFDAYKKQYNIEGDEIQAFGRLRPKLRECILYIKDPEWEWQPEFIGHEVAHCIWGRWHPSR